MKQTKSTLATSVAALLAMGSIFSCVGNATASASTINLTTEKAVYGVAGAVSSKALTIGLQADPATLDPSLSSALVDRQVMANLYDTLFALTPKGQIVPNLVKSYKVSKDGKTYTFTLRSGIKFQDGTAFNAAAVKFNLDRDRSATSARRSELASVKSVSTPNSSTVVVTLSEPYSPLLGVLTDRSGMMVSPTAVQKEGADYPNHPVGTGPFAFQSRVIGDHITLTANTHYWKGKPKLQTVTFKAFSDPNVELTNLQSGAIQLSDQIPAQQLSTLKSDHNYVVSNTAGLGYQGVYLNTTEAPFNNMYLREAVDAAINRTLIVDVAFKGEATAGWGPFSPESPVYDKKTATPPAPNGSLVKKLLAKGGKSGGFSFTLQTANSPVSTEVAQMMQGMLAQYNIHMDIQQLEFGTLLANNTNHAFQASALGWSGRIDPDSNAYPFWSTGGADNGSNFSDPLVDKLLNHARQVQSMSARKVVYDQFMNEMHKQDPYIFLYFQNNAYAYSSNLHGFQSYPDGVFRVFGMSLS